ncbi:flagellar biosynthesis protein FlhF [Alkalithermobacter paradoxus]|uniref:Flagellar biosynthesis protein FlhF n=1 Tax=Alkalithermobacter paradoxus TaxID=29349 RepID=A0A1V4IAZ9_9FIRM|nr:flagellar biosynthesis protein FlhF [[Clostridium] thermoalcaliphilum]
MQIRKFTGDNTQEVMDKVKKELGEKAIILHTKRVKKDGFLGLLKKEKVEILAAIENENVDIKPSEKLEVKKVDIKPQKHNNISLRDNIESHDVKNIKEEIQELKEFLKKINNKVTIGFDKEGKINDKFKEIYDKLKMKGVSSQLIEDILLSMDISYEQDIQADKHLENYLVEKFDKPSSKFNKKINVFVGPTGVGKTTTLAKLASESVLKYDKKIGLLTLDTYRIGAVDQLKVYAEILNCPIEVVYDVSDINQSIERLKNRDLIFVDTAGRSHKNKKHMKELKDILDTFNDKDVYLVINANWNVDDIKDIINEYSFLQEYKIIVTKLDETNRLGIILDILSISNKSIVYTTFGQNVPDDIEEFDIKKYINELLKG